MEFELFPGVNHILILGAGSSTDYGLPVWKDLGPKIREKVSNDISGSYKYKKEIKNWIDKIGEGNTYTTLDECIFKESVSETHYTDGIDVENEIFSVIKDIFNDLYIENNNGWIRKLNEKILQSASLKLEERLTFINYNYDHVLDDNFLNYDYLPIKHRRVTYKPRLDLLSSASVKALYPHGTLFPKYTKRPSHVRKYFNTVKTQDGDLLDAVSCHESDQHAIGAPYDSSKRKVYILGLGGGLKINLDKIIFTGFDISEVHVTVRDKKILTDIVNYLSEKFKITPSDIKVYDNCTDLVENCF